VDVALNVVAGNITGHLEKLFSVKLYVHRCADSSTCGRISHDPPR
jgi:hypothetical protein